MFQPFTSFVRTGAHALAGSLYHIVIVALSGGIALLLPSTARYVLALWSDIEHHTAALIAVEMGVALLLIAGISAVTRGLRDRRLAAAAAGAGLVSFFPQRARHAARHISRIRDTHAAGRTIKVIGSSGYSTLVDQVGTLASVLDKCLGAQILLANPYSPDVHRRIRAIDHPERTIEDVRHEVRQSIALLKRLKAMGKAVTLKLYADAPLVKMVILGDYLWLQPHHADSGADAMPEYVLRRNPDAHSLYTLYAHYFEQRWADADMPDYDLDTDELVYRNRTGGEIRRERFDCETLDSIPASAELAWQQHEWPPRRESTIEERNCLAIAEPSAKQSPAPAMCR
ncbi:MAG: hypothetical protein U0412_05820 [Nitrospira sp.]